MSQWISVIDRLPPHKGEQYLALTEEGAVWLLEYKPPWNAKKGDPTSWHDDEHDSGYVIAWAPFKEPAGDFSPLLKKWEAARDREEEEE